MNEVLKYWPVAFGYLDGVLIFNENIEKYFEHLRAVINRLRRANLKLKRKKCDFLKCELYYSGYLISGKGIYP